MIRIYQNVLRTTVFKTRTLVFFAGILIQYFQRYIVNSIEMLQVCMCKV